MWKRYQIPIILCVIAFAVRIFFFPTVPESGGFTEAGIAFDGYYEIAENLMNGKGYSRGVPLITDSMRTPLYPFIIVALVSVFGSYYALFVAQIFLGVGNVILSWLIAHEFVGVRGALAVGVLAALEPFSAYLTGVVMTETLFTFVFLLMMWMMLRFFSTQHALTLALAASLLGAATLIRPVTQYFPLLLLFALAVHNRFVLDKKFIKNSALVVGVFLLCIFPWSYRNYVTFGTSSLSAQAVSNAFFALTSSAISLETGMPYEEERTALFKREGVRSIDDIHLGTEKYFKEKTVEELKKFPRGLVSALVISLFTFFTHDGYAAILDHYGVPLSYKHPGLETLLTAPRVALNFILEKARQPEMLVILGRVFWVLTTLCAFAGGTLYVFRRDLSAPLILIAGSVAYFAATTTVLGLATTGRFRIPVNTFIFMFAVYALQWMYVRYWKKSQTIPLLPEPEPKLLLE